MLLTAMTETTTENPTDDIQEQRSRDLARIKTAGT